MTTSPPKLLPVLRGPTSSPDCADCPFSVNGKPKQPVAGEGPIDPIWIAIGEGPGENERRSGHPFVGASGQMVNKALANAGAKREQVWVTNAMLCTPPSATDTQKALARRCCAPRLAEEIAKFPGKPILALGAVAARTFLGSDFSIMEMAGALFHVDGRQVIPTVHPAAILRGGDEGAAHAVDLLFVNLVYDVAKVHNLALGRIQEFSRDIDVEYANSKRAEQLIAGIAAEAVKLGSCAIDYEADAPEGRDARSPIYARPTAIAIATVERGVSVLWALLTPRARNLIMGLFGNRKVAKTFHNRVYDSSVCEVQKLPLRGPVHCTLLLHHNAFPGSPHDLQRVTTQFFPVTPWKVEYRKGEKHGHELEEGETVEAAALREHTTYNALDALATARLAPVLQICVKKTDTERSYAADLVMAEIAERKHRVGFPLDLEINAEMTKHFVAEVARARVSVEKDATRPEILEALLDRLAFEHAKLPRKGTGDRSGRNKSNRLPDPTPFLERHAVRLQELRDLIARGKWQWKIGSSMEIAAYIRAKGLPLYAESKKTGRLSTSAKVLENLGYVPELADLIEFREADKMRSTFCEGMLRGFNPATGRCHPRWSVNAITGREKAESPMCMNIPKGRRGSSCKTCGKVHAAFMPNLRKQVRAPKGRRFVGFDMAQLEARVISHESGDPWMRDVFAHPPSKFGPGDIHSRFAVEVWKDFQSYDKEARSELREFIKPTEYGGFYGGSVDTLMSTLLLDNPHVKRVDIEKIVAVLRGTLRGVVAWQNELIATVARPPHELRESVLGRRRTFPLGNGSMTDIYNFPVQSAGRSILILGYMRLWPILRSKFPTAEIILDVHDAAVIECDEADAVKIEPIVEECFSTELTHPITRLTTSFPCEPKSGQDWSEV